VSRSLDPTDFVDVDWAVCTMNLNPYEPPQTDPTPQVGPELLHAHMNLWGTAERVWRIRGQSAMHIVRMTHSQWLGRVTIEVDEEIVCRRSYQLIDWGLTYDFVVDDVRCQARGSYHCLNTCNCWVGRALRSCGVRTGWFTPLPKTVFFYLP